MLHNDYILNILNEHFSNYIYDITFPHKLLTISLKKEIIKDCIFFLKTNKKLKFNFLTDITGIHYPDQKYSLVVVYHLHSFINNNRIRIKCFLSEKNPIINSITSIFRSANWMERETYDFFGIIFDKHPDLRRILNVDDMVAFPMKKNFPLEDPNRNDKNDSFFGR